MRLQAAVFDMDGTLLDSMHIWDQLGPNALRSMGIEPEPDLHEKLKVMTFRDGAQYCKDRYRMTQSVDEIVALTIAPMEEFYLHEVQTKPGVLPFLSMLKMQGVGMYVATNTDRYLAEAGLRRTGLEPYFKGLITCAEAGAGKADSPEIFLRAMRRLRGNLQNTVIFEDSLHAIRTAKAAGFRVCAVYDPSAEEDQEEIRRLADTCVRSFEEFLDPAGSRQKGGAP